MYFKAEEFVQLFERAYLGNKLVYTKHCSLRSIPIDILIKYISTIDRLSNNNSNRN